MNLESSGDKTETLVPLETVDTLAGKAVVLNESSAEIFFLHIFYFKHFVINTSASLCAVVIVGDPPT